jgi:hypothetical protein
MSDCALGSTNYPGDNNNDGYGRIHMQSLDKLKDKVIGCQGISIHVDTHKIDIIRVVGMLLPKSNHGQE